eukprot:1191564-Prorocentrum_minimum.AAC.2
MPISVTVRMYSAPDVARSARGNDAGQQQTTDGRTMSIRRNMSVDETQALWAAAMHGRVDELRALVELGADFNAKLGVNGFTPLHVAAAHGHVEAVRAL